MATIDGDNGPNTLTGGEDDDSVRGFRGDDLLKGGVVLLIYSDDLLFCPSV